MHDTVHFESLGIPSVFVASSVFEEAADAQAEALGLPDVARVFVPHPIQDANDAELAERAATALRPIVASLAGG